jgi:hypothetical protein
MAAREKGLARDVENMHKASLSNCYRSQCNALCQPAHHRGRSGLVVGQVMQRDDLPTTYPQRENQVAKPILLKSLKIMSHVSETGRLENITSGDP